MTEVYQWIGNIKGPTLGCAPAASFRGARHHMYGLNSASVRNCLFPTGLSKRQVMSHTSSYTCHAPHLLEVFYTLQRAWIQQKTRPGRTNRKRIKNLGKGLARAR